MIAIWKIFDRRLTKIHKRAGFSAFGFSRWKYVFREIAPHYIDNQSRSLSKWSTKQFDNKYRFRVVCEGEGKIRLMNFSCHLPGEDEQSQASLFISRIHRLQITNSHGDRAVVAESLNLVLFFSSIRALCMTVFCSHRSHLCRFSQFVVDRFHYL